MGEIVIIIGGLSVVYGAFEFLSYGENGNNNWKNSAIKVIGGLIVAGVGILMKRFGI